MGMEDDRRGTPGRRDYDSASAEWRGRITEQVRAHDHRLTALDVDWRSVSQKVEGVEQSLVRVHGRLDDMSGDINAAMDGIDRARELDRAGAQAAIDRARGSLQNLLFFLIAPLLIAIIAGLVVFVVTGHASR